VRQPRLRDHSQTHLTSLGTSETGTSIGTNGSYPKSMIVTTDLFAGKNRPARSPTARNRLLEIEVVLVHDRCKVLSLRLAHTGRLIGVLSGGELALRPASSALGRQPPTARKRCEAGSGATGCDRGRRALLVRANLPSFQGAKDVDRRVTRLRRARRVRQPGCCDGTSLICLKDGELPAGAPTTCAWGTLEERRSISTQTSTSAGALPGS